VNIIEVFVRRPVATTLLTIGIAMAGAIAFKLLPVSPLPQVDFPTISVNASVAGASPEVMAATVATPLERALGRIAGVTELTSNSSQGSTRVILQFELSRDINGAARDVQAAINAARSLLPTSLSNNPTYRKINPSEFPILILALTSDQLSRGEMYDAASTILAQKISQIEGVGDVSVGGGALPAVRVDINPTQLNNYGISLDSVSSAISSTNSNQAKGFVEQGDRRWQVGANDQALKARDYIPLIITYRKGAPVRLGDVAEITDSVENIRSTAVFNGEPAVLVQITRQPEANIIETVDRIEKMIPSLQASIPASIKMAVAADRSITIRTGLRDVEFSLILSVVLVTLVVFLFLRDARATLIPTVAVPVSLIGTFSIMYLAGFSLNNLSLMALTIATGFVVDDAIVVLENVSRHMEAGVPRFKAALMGAREVGFTVVSMSLSLIAVFIPILLMGGVIGRLFREFAITLSVAIMFSLLISLTTTPMMCARILRSHRRAPNADGKRGGLFGWMQRRYEGSLRWALENSFFMMLLLAAVVCVNVYLYVAIPKTFFPQQDTGMIRGFVSADQSMSFQAMEPKLRAYAEIVQKDPAVATVSGSVGGGGGGGGGANGSLFVALKPLRERKVSADTVITRLRTQTTAVTGAQLFLFADQDLRAGGRQSNSQYQYTLRSDDIYELREWEPKIRNALANVPQITDVSTDSQNRGLETTLVFDRDTIARLGLTTAQINSALYNAFGQRQVSTLYKSLNQYHVIMEVAPQFAQGPEALRGVYVVARDGSKIPLSAFARFEPTNAALSVNHQGQFVASTVSFNLVEGVSLSQATDAINFAMANVGAPAARPRGVVGGARRVVEGGL
jgi:multidrug efflux pump